MQSIISLETSKKEDVQCSEHVVEMLYREEIWDLSMENVIVLYIDGIRKIDT